MGRTKPEVLPEVLQSWGVIGLVVPSLSDFKLSVSHNEMLQEQQSDSSLKEVIDHVLSATVVNSAVSGYFVQNGLLFRKWVVLGNDFVGQAILILGLLTKFKVDTGMKKMSTS